MEKTPDPNIIVQKNIPNSTAVLVLGILSIVCCWTHGIVGLALGIVALVLSGKARHLYAVNPKLYSENSYKNLNAGRTCAIIGTALSGFLVLITITILIFFGVTLTGIFGAIPWDNIFHNF